MRGCGSGGASTGSGSTRPSAITNTSGGPIDRVELNTIAARIGNIALDPVTVDGVAVKATRSDQTIVVPLGGILPMGGDDGDPGPVRRRRCARTCRARTGCSRRRTGSSTCTAGCRGSAAGRPFARPNHGDPFVTPSSPSVHVRIVTDRKLTLRDDRRADRAERGRPDARLRRPRTCATSRSPPPPTTGSRRGRSATTSSASTTARADPGRRCSTGPPMRSRRWRPGSVHYPYPTLRVVQSSGAYGMESPGMIWIPTGAPRANLRYLTAHETAHQWFYGIVGNDQARQPFADEAAADFVARHVTGPAAEPAAARPAGSTSRSTSTARPATTRGSTSRAATCSSRARKRDRPERVLGGACASTSSITGSG